MNRLIRLLHSTPKEAKPYALLPIGLYCNAALQKAHPGSIIEFWTDWRHDKRELVRKCKIAINSSIFTFMAKSIYGSHIRIADMLNRWEAMAVNEGWGKDGFSQDECLLIEVCMINENEI